MGSPFWDGGAPGVGRSMRLELWLIGVGHWMPVRLPLVQQPKSDKGLLSASLTEEGSRN